jgi:hypothetical protein
MDSFNTTFWGPYFWKTLHYIALSFPNEPSLEIKNNARALVNSLQFLLPCEFCRNHFSENIKIYPLTDEVLSSKVNFYLWIHNFHNIVNIASGKKEMSLEDSLLTLYDPEHISKCRINFELNVNPNNITLADFVNLLNSQNLIKKIKSHKISIKDLCVNYETLPNPPSNIKLQKDINFWYIAIMFYEKIQKTSDTHNKLLYTHGFQHICNLFLSKVNSQ